MEKKRQARSEAAEAPELELEEVIQKNKNMLFICFVLVCLASTSPVYANGEVLVDKNLSLLSETRKRRERYSGKFPRKYNQKYKELNSNNTIIERGKLNHTNFHFFILSH